MERIIITTDCVCDLPDTLIKEYGLGIMYYYIHTGRGRFQDRLEITSENLIELIQIQGESVYTEVAGTLEYYDFFRSLYKEDLFIVHIAAGQHISDAYNHAAEAAKSFKQVHVVDSEQLSSGLGILALAAAQWASEGRQIEDLLQKIEQLKKHFCTSFIVTNTQQMYLNGKISSRLKNFCDFFQLHPLLAVHNGKIKPRGFYIGKVERYYKKYVRRLLKNKNVNSDILFINFAGLPAAMQEKLVTEAIQHHCFRKIFVDQVSPTITCNCGLGTFGFMFVKHHY